MYNHPLIGEISLGPNETKTITREFSKFSLGNIAGKVSLVLPDGKIADTVEYAKEKIAEDEAYAKINGKWQWILPNAQDENEINKENADISGEQTSGIDEENTDNGEVLGAADENDFTLSNYKNAFNSESFYIFLSRINFLPLSRQETNYCPATNPSSNIAYLIASLI